MMNEPDFDLDGWCLESGERRHLENPDTFPIPDRQHREGLRQGDIVKLIFRVKVDDEAETEAFERMWVIVQEPTPEGYIGVLDNDPFSITANNSLRRGTVIFFGPHHVIDIESMDEDAVEAAPHHR